MSQTVAEVLIGVVEQTGVKQILRSPFGTC
jgi:hypothetical protein